LGETQRKFHAVCSAPDREGANKSPPLPFQKGITKKKKWTKEYPNLPSATHTVPLCKGVPIPEPCNRFFPLECDEEGKNTHKTQLQPSMSRDQEFFLNITSAEPHKIMQKILPDLIRELELSKYKAEHLSSRLQQWNLLGDTVEVALPKDFEQFFITQSKLSDCKNIKGLMAAISIRYNPEV
jgi:hypothetical protein